MVSTPSLSNPRIRRSTEHLPRCLPGVCDAGTATWFGVLFQGEGSSNRAGHLGRFHGSKRPRRSRAPRNPDLERPVILVGQEP